METEEQKSKRVTEERAIMFMDPNKMDERARQYWEFTRAEILSKSVSSAGGDNGGGGNDGDGGNVTSV